jgi:beta-N-acetylhexosaminidase
MARTPDLRTYVGQLITFGFDGTTLSPEVRSTLNKIQPGGVILFARNIVDPRQTHALLSASQKEVATKMFLCVDLEGGTVDRLRDIVAPAPAVADVVQAGRKVLFREHGRVIGEEVSALGFNVDFAPVFDLRFEASLSVLTSRTASAEPSETVNYIREFLRGLKDANVLGCGKHFPGLGEANLDSHEVLPVVKKPMAKMWMEDLVPYRTLHRQLPFVMCAHCAYPEVTKDNTPATLSRKWLTDVLRKRVGYKGLVICDDLDMGGVLAAASAEDAAIETMKAGADIFLVCRNQEHVTRSYEAVLRLAEKNARFRQTVETAGRRILAFKKKSPALNRRPIPAPTDAKIDKLRRKLWTLSEEIRLAIGTEVPV